jgi:hypothetical protein
MIIILFVFWEIFREDVFGRQELVFVYQDVFIIRPILCWIKMIKFSQIMFVYKMKSLF